MGGYPGGGWGGTGVVKVGILLMIGGYATASQSMAMGRLEMAATPSSFAARFRDLTGFIARLACGEHRDERCRIEIGAARLEEFEFMAKASGASVQFSWKNCKRTKTLC